MNISHIVTNGCSFTYCQGLPISKGWPGLIANDLNCNLVNLGLPGSGNDSIYRRTCEYLYNSLNYPDSKPLVIICWSQPWRMEMWLDSKEARKSFSTSGYYMLTIDINNKQFFKNTKMNSYEVGLLENWSDEDHYRRTMIAKISMINLLESMNIPYIMTDMMFQRDVEEICQRVDSNFPQLAERISSNKYYIKPAYEKTADLTPLPCGHDDVAGQEALRSYMLEKINELHPNINFTKTNNYYNLKDYVGLNGLHAKFPEWCTFSLNSDKIV